MDEVEQRGGRLGVLVGGAIGLCGFWFWCCFLGGFPLFRALVLRHRARRGRVREYGECTGVDLRREHAVVVGQNLSQRIPASLQRGRRRPSLCPVRALESTNPGLGAPQMPSTPLTLPGLLHARVAAVNSLPRRRTPKSNSLDSSHRDRATFAAICCARWTRSHGAAHHSCRMATPRTPLASASRPPSGLLCCASHIHP